MLLAIKILALQLAWLGAVPVYCTSQQQRILRHPLPKPLAWFIFYVAMLSAAWMLSHVYLWLTACFIVAVVVMMVWILLAISMPHCTRPSLVIVSLSVLMLLVALPGGDYVA